MSGKVKTIATEDTEFTEEIESKTARLPVFSLCSLWLILIFFTVIKEPA
jgi:hypothetical protein